MPDAESTTSQISDYWNAFVQHQDVGKVPLEADLADTIKRLHALNVAVPGVARDRVRAVVQAQCLHHREGVAPMSTTVSLTAPPSLASCATRASQRSGATQAIGRRHISALTAMLVLVLLLGAASLPFLRTYLGGPPKDLAILPALTLQDDSTPAVQEITGDDDPFVLVSGIAVDNAGKLYVIDAKRDHVRVFDADGSPRDTWGTSGDGPGEFGFSFDFPWGDLAVAPDGNLYVMDPNLARIQKFTPDGTYLLGFGQRGSEDSQFLFPNGIAVGPDGHVYVADYQNHRVQVFAGDGAFLASWDGAGADGPPLAGPSDVAVSPDGTVWVTDDILQKIIGFAPDGSVVTSFGAIGGEPGQIRGPAGIAIDANGNLYVADRGNDRIQKFAPDGTLLGLAGSRGKGPGELTQPVYVAVGPDGAAYVTEDGVGRVQRFPADALAQPIATPGTEAGA